MPDPNTAKDRADQGEETSINWEDDATVLGRTHAGPNAAHGAARVERATIDYVGTRRQTLQKISAERQRLDDNPHHGNIVFDAGLSKAVKKAAANSLALDSEYLPKPKKPN